MADEPTSPTTSAPAGPGPSSTPATTSTGTSAAQSSPATSPGPGAAPSAAPPPSTGIVPDDKPASSPADPFDFSSIFESPLDGGEATIPAAAVGAAGQTVLPPGAEPKAQQPPAPAAVPVAAPGQQDTAPSAAQPQAAQSSPPALDPADPEQLARALVENEDAAIAHLAQTMFAISPEEAGALEADMPGMLPKAFARAFVKAQQQNLMQIARIVPQMIHKQTQLMVRNSRNEAKFYERWPGIDRAKHSDVINRYAATYRQVNPTATMEKMIEDLGPLIYMVTGTKPPDPKPASAVAANGARPPQPAFVPAGSNASVAQSSSPTAGPFDWLGQRE